MRIQKLKIFMCGNQRAGGAGCISAASLGVWESLKQQAKSRPKPIEIQKIKCMGCCGEGPNLKIFGGDFFHKVTVDDIAGILDKAEEGHL